MFLVIVMIFVSMKRRENNLSNYEKKKKTVPAYHVGNFHALHIYNPKFKGTLISLHRLQRVITNPKNIDFPLLQNSFRHDTRDKSCMHGFYCIREG